MNLQPFDIEAAKHGRPVCTRDGRKARIICFDRIGYRQPITALVTNSDGNEDIETYYLDGRFNDDINDISDYDLMMLPEKKTGWINIYPKGYSYSTTKSMAETGNIIYPTKESAVDNALHDCIATISIEWEE